MSLYKIDKNVIYEWISEHETFGAMDDSVRELIACRTVLYELTSEMWLDVVDGFDEDAFMQLLAKGDTKEAYTILKKALGKFYEKEDI